MIEKLSVPDKVRATMEFETVGLAVTGREITSPGWISLAWMEPLGREKVGSEPGSNSRFERRQVPRPKLVIRTEYEKEESVSNRPNSRLPGRTAYWQGGYALAVPASVTATELAPGSFVERKSVALADPSVVGEKVTIKSAD